MLKNKYFSNNAKASEKDGLAVPNYENNGEPFPLTDVQMAYLMGRDGRFELGGTSTHVYIEIESKMNIKDLNNSLQRLINRHPMLRAIIMPDGRQCILKDIPKYKIEVVDLTDYGPMQQRDHILCERERMSHFVFKTDQWPLFEFKAFRLSNEINYLFIGIDVLIADAQSIQIMANELVYFYNNPEADLDDLEYSFRDFIGDLYKLKNSEKYHRDREFWMSKLENFSLSPQIPLIKAPAIISKPRFNRKSGNIKNENWNKIKNICRQRDIRPTVILCTAYAQVLAYWSNQSRFAINFTVSNRLPFIEYARNIIGDFTSVMLLEVNMESRKSFWECAEEIQNTLNQALEHTSYDGIEFISEISSLNNLGNHIVMPVVFSSLMSGDYQEVWSQLGEIKYAITQTSQLFLDNQVTKSVDGINIRWDYVEQLFEEEVISGMFDQYINILNNLVDTGSEYKIEMHKSDRCLLDKYNLTGANIRTTTLNNLFMEQVCRTPDNTAVELEGDRLTYAELDELSEKVACYLRVQGIKKGDMVGILATREIHTIVNILAVLKAGAAYVPLNSEHPEERRKYIMENSGCKLLLDSDIADQVKDDQDFPRNNAFTVEPDDTAYVIYTSGSTGKPKGVVITHGAVYNTIIDINTRFDVNENDRIIGLSSMCFDLSVYDIFGALISGAALYLVHDQRDAEELIQVLKTKRITIWNSVPAIMDMCIDAMEKNFVQSDLRLVMLSGDWIPLSLPLKIKNYFLNAGIISLGGATEASIWSIFYPIDEIRDGWKSIPYGFPLTNQNFYVLNYNLEECPVNVQGELYIGGIGVAKEYLNDIEKTESAFINHPVLGRIYRTGDYGVMRREGYIEFLGRKDSQVKIRGYRIEMGEIESCLNKYRTVRNSVVVDFEDKSGRKLLCAYIVADEKASNQELREFLANKLPDYMIPSNFVYIDEVPLTPNGKVDKKALPMPVSDENLEKVTIVPRNRLEEKLLKISQQVLGIEKIGIDESFFDLGGNSIKAQRLIGLIDKNLNVRMNIRDLYAHSTIENIARYIRNNTSQIVDKTGDSELLSNELCFYWSPSLHWEVIEGGVCIQNRIYGGVANKAFPELYFLAQKGITRELLAKSFKSLDSKKLDELFSDLVKNKVLINTLQKPKEIFTTQEKLFKNVFGEAVLYDTDEYYRFKKKQLNRDLNSACTYEELLLNNKIEFPDFIRDRRTHRVFMEYETITFEAFSHMLSVLRQNRKGDKESYYYATAGGFYPIDIFVYVKKNRVQNVPEGLYYFSPVRNSLSLVNSEVVITEDSHFFRNKSVFKSSAFSIFMVYNAEANMPIYGGNGYYYACIDCGIMIATLTQAAELLNIGLCSIGEMNFEMIEGFFKLNENQVLIHTIEAGLKAGMPIEAKDEMLPYEFGASTKDSLSCENCDLQIEIDDVYMGKEGDLKNINIPFPLNNIQHAYLIGREGTFELGNTSSHYFIEIETQMNYERFNESVKKVIQRHSMLRAVLIPDDGMQVILSSVPEYNVGFEDISDLCPKERESRISKQREIMNHQVFKVDQWPLFEFKMMKFDDRTNYLFISFDLLISDGASFAIIVRDIMHYYENPEVPLKDIEFSFRDYILACNDLKLSEAYEADRQYWLGKLPDFPPSPKLLLKQKLADVKKPVFKQLKRKISNEGWNKLKAFARSNKITQSALLCAAFSEVMALWSNQSRFILDLTIFNRYPFHKDVEDIVGDFTSLILLAVDFTKHNSFVDRAMDIQDVISESLEHKNYNGVEFIRDVSKFNNYSLKTVAPIVFTSMLFDYAGEGTGDISRLGKLKAGASQTPQVYLDCQVSEYGGGLYISWDYIEQLFEEEIINGIFEQFIGILEEIIKKGFFNGLTCLEKDMKFLEEYNKTEEKMIIAPIHELFTKQTCITPDNTAVISSTGSITYRQLDEVSNQVANYLRERGIGRNCFVGVLGERCENSIVNVIGILKTGAAYVPIDPEYPEERRKYIKGNSGFEILLDADSYKNFGISSFPREFAADPGMLEDIAYVIYTSGSTGRPKGVVIKHGSVANTILDINRKFKICSSDKIIGISSMSFDLSLYDIFGALSTGATLIMVPDQRDVSNLIDIINKNNITFWNSVPAIMDMALDNVDESYVNHSLRLVLLSGDWIPLRLPDKIRKHFVNADVISLGGATEASIWSIFYPIDKVADNWKSIPYGMPLANQKFYVLNFDRKPCPVGVEGELYIGGVGLASEYMNDSEKTKSSFINHPEFGRLYRTGDYGVMHRNGYIEFLGRKDYQVKIRGYRIELGEIEIRLMEHENVRNAVVIDGEDNSDKKYLCAYIVSDIEVEVQELREYLLAKLPEYMIPTYFIRLDVIPLTPNGKVDRKVLPTPEADTGKSSQYEAPRNKIEQMLVNEIQDIMGIENVGIHDNFFELGGDSIKAIQISSRIQKHGFKMKMQDMFRLSTILELGGQLKPIFKKVEQSIITGAVKLGPAQRWFFENVKTGRHHWNQSFILYRSQGFEESMVRKVMDKILEHHDALRITFKFDGQIEQFNMGKHENMYRLKPFDLKNSRQYNWLMLEKSLALQKSMDLSNGPLVNVGLFKTHEGDYLLFTVHHLVVDGVGGRILMEDFANGYSQLLSGEDIRLQDKTASFKDWMEALSRYSESRMLLSEVPYWKEQEDKKIDSLLVEGPVIDNRFDDGDMYSISLSSKDTVNLTQHVNRAYNMNINDALLSALGLAIKEWAGIERIAVNLEGHGREDVIQDIDISRTIGWFTSMYPVILDFSRTDDISHYIKQVKETLRQVPNKGLSYGVLRYLTPDKYKTQLAFSIKPQISFNYLGKFEEGMMSGNIRIKPVIDQSLMGGDTERAYLIDVVGYMHDGKLIISAIFNKYAFSSDKAEKLMDCYKKKIQEIIQHCMHKEKAELTPDDLEYKKLSLKELEDITDFINM